MERERAFAELEAAHKLAKNVQPLNLQLCLPVAHACAMWMANGYIGIYKIQPPTPLGMQ